MKKISLYIYWLCAFTIFLVSFIYYPKSDKKGTEATISWDVSGYYWYLPAFLIYDHPEKTPFAQPILDKYSPASDYQQAFLHEKSGNYVMKYSAGLSLQFLPAFWIAHNLAKPLGYEPDGFSKPYQVAIHVSSFLMALLGLWYFRKILLLYFEDWVVATVLFLLTFCSNYLNYSAIDSAMTHSWLFTWYSILIWNSHLFYQKTETKRAIYIGAILGIMVLTRPTELLALLIPLLWGIDSFDKNTFFAHLLFIKNNFLKYVIAFITMLCIVSIQPLYWHYITGEWIVYSYQDQGFSWLRPHFKDYLFSYRSGWLLYTPLMIFAYLGFLPLFNYIKERKNLKLEKIPKLAITIFILLNTYVICAWDIWWFGGRAMVQSYPLLAFPLAAFVTYVFEKKYWKYIVLPFFAFFLYYNIWWTHGSHRGGMFDPMNMTRGYLYNTLGDWKEKREKRILFDTNEWFKGEMKNIQLLANQDFENDTLAILDGQNHLFELSKKHKFSPLLEAKSVINGSKWLKISADLKIDNREWDVWKMPQLIVIFSQNEVKVKENVVRPSRVLEQANVTENFSFHVKIPKKEYNRIRVYFWNVESDKKMWIDNVKIESHD